MGVFTHPLEVGDPRGERFETVDAMVDTGATFTVLPSAQLERLGVQVRRKARFRIANGSVMEFNVGETVVRLGGQTITTPVVFAEEGTPTILGAVALETALLAVDPVGQTLVPTDGLIIPNPTTVRFMRARTSSRWRRSSTTGVHSDSAYTLKTQLPCLYALLFRSYNINPTFGRRL